MPPFDTAKFSRLMTEQGIDTVLATTRHNARYLTGGYYHHFVARTPRSGAGRYLSVVGIPRDLRGAFHVGGRDEAELIERDGGMWIEERLTPESGRGGTGMRVIVRAAAALRARGLDRGTIGVEMPFLPADAFVALRQELPSATLVDATPLLGELRAVKRPEEIEILHQVHRLTNDALRATMATATAGQTTRQLAQAVERHIGERGGVFLYCLASVGPSYARAPGEERWTPGHSLHIDAGAEVGDYVSDICRMGSLGEAPPEAKAMYEQCIAVSDELRTQVRAGLPCKDVLTLGQALIRATRWGEHGGFTAHGLGMVSHEPPALNSAATRPLEAGMVLSLETEFRRPDIGHVKFEDTVVVTPTGCEGLWDTDREWCTAPG